MFLPQGLTTPERVQRTRTANHFPQNFGKTNIHPHTICGNELIIIFLSKQINTQNKMKTILIFKQAVLGIPYFDGFDEVENAIRREYLADDGTKIVETPKREMNDFEKMIFDEYNEDQVNYSPSLTGDLF